MIRTLSRIVLYFTLIPIGTLLAADSQPGTSTSLEEEVRLLREEVSMLRSEVRTLKSELRGASPQAAVATAESVPSSNSVVQAQVAELAQTKVESNSKMPVKIYGTILSTTFFNNRAVNWFDQPNEVGPAAADESRTGTFSSSLRQSRIGLLIDGPKLGRFSTSGVFALDFNGGQTDYKASPLLGLANIVYAYARFESSRTAFEAGQDESILAPLNPTSLVAFSLPELYRTGNLYLRAPQVRAEQLFGGGKLGQFKAVVGLVAPVGTYPANSNQSSSLSQVPLGWQRPAVQSRLSWMASGTAPGEKPLWEVGASGHYGRIGAGDISASSWAGSFDFSLNLHRTGLGAEGYVGNNLGSFGGGVGQFGRTKGGFIEARFLATNRLKFNAGVGTDHLTSSFFIPGAPRSNSAVFANTIFQFTPEIGASFEYRYMFTKPNGTTTLFNNNLNLGLAYSF